ncbi:P63C domain-containing protein [Flavobacterium ajazii]|uniref:P63C domain-containing protein n=1 Tax=Flavobacterium ajazii TaxID=2692318 RepID=UPI0013D727B0|nr:P63C domain-containing protein [Flavobacterium ajazii]
MAKKEVLTATHGSDKTPLKLGSVEIPCYVLSNGQRVLSRNGIQKALGYEGTSGDWLINFVNNKKIKGHFSAGVFEALNSPIEFERSGAGGSASKTYGHDATILIDLCDTIIEAKNAGELTPRQLVYASFAEIIIRSVAKVGIVALVDEATGYQYEREKDALQVVLKAYINTELLKWQKNFPDSFYFEIFRLNNWDYTVNGIKKRPRVIGTWTNELIYKQLPKGVLEELKSKTPKSESGNYTARFFQSLTPDIGHPALTAQIYKVIGIMSASNSWAEFKHGFNRMIDRANGQIEINFESIEKKIEKEEKPIKKQEELSMFNLNLKKGLEYNPKEDRKKKE